MIPALRNRRFVLKLWLASLGDCNQRSLKYLKFSLGQCFFFCFFFFLNLHTMAFSTTDGKVHLGGLYGAALFEESIHNGTIERRMRIDQRRMALPTRTRSLQAACRPAPRQTKTRRTGRRKRPSGSTTSADPLGLASQILRANQGMRGGRNTKLAHPPPSGRNHKVITDFRSALESASSIVLAMRVDSVRADCCCVVVCRWVVTVGRHYKT